MAARRNRRKSTSAPAPTPKPTTPPPGPRPPRPSRDKISFNEGKVLLHLAKTTYTTMIQVIAEAVQNALDADATNIWIAVDEGKRTIVIADDGSGVTIERFGEALRSIGQGVKPSDKLGRFGLGLISPLDKCTHYTFTSRVPGERTGNVWTFRKSDIEVQDSRLTISRAEVKWTVAYNSVMRIFGYTRDTQTAGMTPARIAEFVRDKLGPNMRKRGVTCTLNFKAPDGTTSVLEIKPTDFNGEAFEVVTYTEPDAGDVEFELYRSPKTSKGRRGAVVFSEMDALYPITWPEFKRQAGGLLSEEVRTAFSSGYFEGVIRAKKVELHPNRKKFMPGDQVLGLCIAIELWFEEVGRALYLDEQVREQETRFQRLGVQTLEQFKDLLNDPMFSHLKKVLQALQVGSVSTGHAEVGEGKESPQGGIRSGQGGAGKPRAVGTGESRKPTDTESKGPERPGDTPGVSYGPEGRNRKMVRDNSTGIGIIHEVLPGSDRLWEIDVTSAMIYINVRHPVFLLVEHADTYILQLQEWIIIQALSLLQFPEESRSLLHDYSDSHAREMVVISIIGSRNRRKIN